MKILDALSLAAKEANTFLRTEAERSLVLLFDIPQKGLKGVEVRGYLLYLSFVFARLFVRLSVT